MAFNTANDNGEDGVEVSCPSFMAHNTASNNGAENFNLVGDGCTDVDNTSPDEDSCTENTLAAC